MSKLSLALKPECKSDLPIKAIQFGEGNFLRCFLDWMIFRMNSQNLFNGRVLVVQPSTHGHSLPVLKSQDNLFTAILHGMENGKTVETFEIINTIADCKNAYDESDWEDLKKCITSEDLEFVFSNTTEAGIVYVQEPLPAKGCPQSFPGKLTQLLCERFKALKGKKNAGLFIMPCELIEKNGEKLREIILKLADDWKLGDDFKAYVNNECTFLNTLVDRVVSGYPKADAKRYEEQLGYEDAMMTTGETFNFLAIEGGDEVKEKLPLQKAGLNVVVASDITPYRLRKVRILNGAHTSNVPAAFLAGLDTVDQMMTHEVTGKFARSVIYDEIIPAVNLDKQMLTEFADAVVDRFMDPSLHHQLASILMNCTSKIKARVLPSILDARAKGVLPKKLCFALAAYFALYKNAGGVSPVKVQRADGKSGEFQDDQYAVEALSKAWSFYQKSESSAQSTVKAILSDTKLWGRDLSSDVDLMTMVAKLTHAVITDGILPTMRDLQENA
ncbi:MAG: tagaturonate reductase [Succinivibrio sp.]|nr:tagaturonate reductase [Succinivibrio sp.]